MRRKKFRPKIIEPQLPGNLLGGRTAVSREHHDPAHSRAPDFFNGPAALRFEFIGDRHRPEIFPLFGNIDRRSLNFHRGKRDLPFTEETGVSRQNPFPIDPDADTVTGHLFNFCHTQRIERPRGRAAQSQSDGVTRRVFGMSAAVEQMIAGDTGFRENTGHLKRAPGEGSRLVEHNR